MFCSSIEVAFEVPADEVVGADEGDFSGHGPDLSRRLLGEGVWEFFVGGEVPFVEEGFPFGEVVGSAQDGFEHGQGVDAGAGNVDEDAFGGRGEEVEDGDVEGPGQGDEVVGGELADPVAGDGAFGMGDHGFAPFLAGHERGAGRPRLG